LRFLGRVYQAGDSWSLGAIGQAWFASVRRFRSSIILTDTAVSGLLVCAVRQAVVNRKVYAKLRFLLLYCNRGNRFSGGCYEAYFLVARTRRHSKKNAGFLALGESQRAEWLYKRRKSNVFIPTQHAPWQRPGAVEQVSKIPQ